MATVEPRSVKPLTAVLPLCSLVGTTAVAVAAHWPQASRLLVATCSLPARRRPVQRATNRAWRDALAAVATGSVLLGDKVKAEADKYKQYNADHVPDVIQPGAPPRGAPTGSASKSARGAGAQALVPGGGGMPITPRGALLAPWKS